MNLLLAAVFLMQDKTAEDIFKNIENTVEAAQSLRLTFKTEGNFVRAGDLRAFWTSRGTILIKGDTRILASSNQNKLEGGEKTEFETRLISDGTRLLHEDSSRKRVLNLPEFFVSHLNSSLMRAGVADTLSLAGSFGDTLSVGGGGPQPKSFFEISNLKVGPKGKRGATITYTLTFDVDRFPDRPAKGRSVTLEYDPVTWKVLSRVTTVKDADCETTTTETYDEISINADISDEKFKLPPEEKSPEARISKAKGDLARFLTALGAYEVDIGSFPTTEQGLAALFTKPDEATRWKGPYVEGRGMLLDPWGISYRYRYPGVLNLTGYDLYSCGPDGKPGTDDDISPFRAKVPEGKK